MVFGLQISVDRLVIKQQYKSSANFSGICTDIDVFLSKSKNY